MLKIVVQTSKFLSLLRWQKGKCAQGYMILSYFEISCVEEVEGSCADKEGNSTTSPNPLLYKIIKRKEKIVSVDHVTVEGVQHL